MIKNEIAKLFFTLGNAHNFVLQIEKDVESLSEFSQDEAFHLKLKNIVKIVEQLEVLIGLELVEEMLERLSR